MTQLSSTLAEDNPAEGKVPEAKVEVKPEAKKEEKSEKPAEKAADPVVKATNPPSNSTTMSGPDKPKVSHLSAFPIIMDPTLKKKEESDEANSSMKM